MSCACENKKAATEYDRIHRLAKNLAKLENCLVGIFKTGAGTYDFSALPVDKDIIEVVSPY